MLIKETNKGQNKEKSKTTNSEEVNKEQNKEKSRTTNSEEINKNQNKEQNKKEVKEISKDKSTTLPDNITLISSPQLQNNKNEEEENNIFNNIKDIINISRSNIARTVNSEMVNCYWNIGKYIYEIQGNKSRADYGTYLIKYLSERLTKEFGRGFSVQNLKNIRQFYETFSIGSTVWSQSGGSDVKLNICPKLLLKLSWSHIKIIMRVDNETRRTFYIKESIKSNWSVRQLERQINTFYYERLLSSQDKEIVKNEINTTEPDIETKTNPLSILKDPYVLDFLNLKQDRHTLEKDIESKIMDKLQNFILEMGKSFAFVGRQYRISIDDDNYYVDLVFYNMILRCYVLIDLKANKLNHADIGQMDFYTRYFNKEVKQDTDNPTIGLILCTDKNKAMVKYTLLEDKNNNIFASKYTLYLPTEEELTKYIIEQRELLEMEEGVKKGES